MSGRLAGYQSIKTSYKEWYMQVSIYVFERYYLDTVLMNFNLPTVAVLCRVYMTKNLNTVVSGHETIVPGRQLTGPRVSGVSQHYLEHGRSCEEMHAYRVQVHS